AADGGKVYTSADSTAGNNGEVKSEKQLKKEQKKAEKQAKFDQKNASKAKAAPATGEPSKKKAAKEKKAEAVVLPPFVEETAEGEKKKIKSFEDPYYSSYHPVAVESAWYSWWEKEGFFKPQFTPEGDVKPEGKFVIVVPPPNVTGALQ
ncbi:hypothetical protein Golomagni_06528, partial [Golovinomyces magnicellulatus]